MTGFTTSASLHRPWRGKRTQKMRTRTAENARIRTAKNAYVKRSHTDPHSKRPRTQSKQSIRLLLQSSELGLPPTHPQASMSSPFGLGGDTLACVRGDGRVPIRTRGETMWSSRYVCTCDRVPKRRHRGEKYEFHIARITIY